MKTFEYSAADARGQAVSGFLAAKDESELDRRLEARGLTLVRARRRRLPSAGRGAQLRGDELLHLTAQLATVCAARVPLVQGLAGIGARMEGERTRGLVRSLADALRAGESLSRAMDAHPAAFPHVYRAAVRAGEASGALAEVLARLARYLQWSRTLRAATIQVLIYPGVLACAVGLLLAVLLGYLLPRILSLFPGGAIDLPPQTRVVMAVSALVQQAALPLVVLGLVAAVLAPLAARAPRTRELVDRLVLALPGVGSIALRFATSRFASTASTLHASGCDVYSVITIGADACGNAALRAGFQRALERVRAGSALGEALAVEPDVDPLLVQMVGVGEQSGELGASLERLVTHYDEEIPRAVKRALALLEPAILLSTGAVVAFLLLAALLPIFQLYETIG